MPGHTCGRIIKIVLYQILFLIIVGGEVIVDFGHWKQPFVKEEGGVTFLKNKDIVVQLRCKASFPTQWIYNEDDKSKNADGRFAQQWTDRKFSKSIDAGVYDYLAWIQLQYSAMREPETLICVAINDTTKKDNRIVTLTPVESDTAVAIANSIGQESAINDNSANSENSTCDVEFLFLNLGSKGLYWQCRGTDLSPGEISFRSCGSAMQCQNAYRNVKKMNKCLTFFENEKYSLDDWNMMGLDNYKAGTALCTYRDTVRAQDYFFSAPEPGSGLRKIEFSWNKIKPSDLVWMDHVENQYYTNEVLDAVCHFPKFGFSFDPYGSLLQNGTRIRLEKSKEVEEDQTWVSEIRYNLTEIGTYVVQCLGPVWNTTEWVNKTKTIDVKPIVPPAFSVNSENATFVEGDVGKKIACSAQGDPMPEIKWENANIPVISVSGGELYFRKVADYVAGPYVCIATNRFGQTARKIFNVHVTKPIPKGSDSESSIGISAIVGIFLALLIAILVLIGFVVFYRKFRKLSGQIAYLTYEEVESFRDGNMSRNPDGEMNVNNASIDCMPYNSKFDVTKEQIFVDENTVLGSGAYGTVLKGTIKFLNSEPRIVAFKTVPKTVDVSYFKALLSELKILAYIGEHPQIVSLIGAWTASIKQRQIYVGVELCKTSILAFLRDNEAYFSNGFHNSHDYSNATQEVLNSGDAYENFSRTFSTVELIQWAEDIATGMDFLASKRVVHGDLAARNVLLSFDMQAKICDFGLARQLIDYNYIKTQSCPLPWKWMAIESLNQMKFSTQSDAWAYGITLWEIFSLGNIPYPGMTWRADFVEKLQAGLRMTCPPHANEVIYNIMIKCWSDSPKARPSFGDIIKVLHAQNRELSKSQVV